MVFILLSLIRSPRTPQTCRCCAHRAAGTPTQPFEIIVLGRWVRPLL
ncbi:hypothetical protein COLINT_03194 [Collinsella intestinalis DSM 13280]|uniref:Uncharacterized protein n=1 Tax=Collinsella intestinalis DSM 13280 TaxID=521003 RepID=C4FAU9_9ACTN|nr:hypothetical protein COLINT_03194 [Collinsella intestinalis DSM 13280]